MEISKLQRLEQEILSLTPEEQLGLLEQIIKGLKGTVLENKNSLDLSDFYPNIEIESIKKKQLLLSINKIVNKLINDDNIFNDINKCELLDSIENLLDNSLIDELSLISQDELIERIKKIMMWESLSGMLNDLTEEQQKIFDEATKVRMQYAPTILFP